MEIETNLMDVDTNQICTSELILALGPKTPGIPLLFQISQ